MYQIVSEYIHELRKTLQRDHDDELKTLMLHPQAFSELQNNMSMMMRATSYFGTSGLSVMEIMGVKVVPRKVFENEDGVIWESEKNFGASPLRKRMPLTRGYSEELPTEMTIPLPAHDITIYVEFQERLEKI